MKRPHLIEAAEAYDEGKDHGYIEGHYSGVIEGRKQGIAMERSRVRKVEWAKLAVLIFLMTLAAILVAYYVTKI